MTSNGAYNLRLFGWIDWAGEQMRALDLKPDTGRTLNVMSSAARALFPEDVHAFEAGSPLQGRSVPRLMHGKDFVQGRHAVEDVLFFAIERLNITEPDTTVKIAGDLAYRLNGAFGARLKTFLLEEHPEHPALPAALHKEDRIKLAAAVSGLAAERLKGFAEEAERRGHGAMLQAYAA